MARRVSAKRSSEGTPVLRPEQIAALNYLKEMLPALRVVAVDAELKFLCYLLEMAAEEAETLAGNMQAELKTQIGSKN